MAELEYFEKKIKINDLLRATGLEIECVNPSGATVKFVDSIDKAIDFASSNITNSHSRVKDVSIHIHEIKWSYYSKFSFLSFENELIELLEEYQKNHLKIKPL
jgi:hypothetical protein